MVKLFKILTFLSLIVFLGAPSCVDEGSIEQRNEDQIRTTRSLIRQEFESNDLSQTELAAFESSARQKLADFADFLKIIADTALDITVRQQAGEMATGIFISAGIPLHIYPSISEKEIRLSDLIKGLLDGNIRLNPFKTDSLEVMEVLHHTGQSEYLGSLTFNLIITDDSGFNRSSIRKITRYHLKKENKVFGTDTLHIWNARLGGIFEEK
jgi:hypothetical protein